MQRVDIQQSEPEAYKAMFGLEQYISNTSIDEPLREVVRIRASVLNNCQFCIGMHSKNAKELGVSKEKITAISNWQDSDLFSPAEQAVLSMTDSVTHISANGLPNDVYQNVAMFFNENEIAQLIMLIAAINTWNRLGVSMSVVT